MSTNPPAPLIAPLGDDDDDNGLVLDDADEQPLDPDLNDDLVNSADADERAATEGELDGTGDDQR